jgi:hypothetical protein
MKGRNGKERSWKDVGRECFFKIVNKKYVGKFVSPGNSL